MSELKCNDPWYQELEKKYGYDYCVLAGYFQETKPFAEKYADHFPLPKGKRVVQLSGAFYPFHEGHEFLVKIALYRASMGTFHPNEELAVVIHADHHGYYSTKGQYPVEERNRLLKEYIERNHMKNGIEFHLINEDDMPDGCSRNFTRLYTELKENNKSVHFICGGDRSNYSLTFVDEGSFVVVGRTKDPKFWLYEKLFSNDMVYNSYHKAFYSENHPASSTEIRNQYNQTI